MLTSKNESTLGLCTLCKGASGANENVKIGTHAPLAKHDARY